MKRLIIFVVVFCVMGCSPPQRGLDNLLCSPDGKCADGWFCADNICESCDLCEHGACADSMCQCEEGWTGNFCDTKADLCADVICDPGYECRPSDGQCVPEGNLCEPDPCNGHGTCDPADGSCTCNCDSEYCWAGTACDTCASDYTGNDCHRDWCVDNACDHGSCVNEACDCEEGWAGTLCDTCASGYHLEGDNCVLDTTCEADSCNYHGTCDDSTGVVVCTCDTGYVGDTCDQCDTGYQDNDSNGTCLPDCANSGLDCGNHGTCDDLSGTAVCVCDTGYTGNDCSQCDTGYQDNDGNDTCLPNCTTANLDCNQVVSGGDCDDSSGTAQCVCNAGYVGADCKTCDTGYHEEQGACVPDDPFQTDPLVALDGPATGSLQSGSVNTLIQFTYTSVGGPSTNAKFSFKFTFSGDGEVMNLIEFREDGVDITDQVMMFEQGSDGAVIFKQGRHFETDETRTYRLYGTLTGFPSGHSLTTSYSKDETPSPTLDGVMGYIHHTTDSIYDVDTGLCSLDGRSVWGDESAGGLFPNLNESTCVISSPGSNDFTYLNIQGSASKTLTAP